MSLDIAAAPDLQATHQRKKERAWPGRLWRRIVMLWKWVFGAILCTNPVLSLLVVGWTQRAGQRSAFRCWWRRSPVHKRGVSFPAREVSLRQREQAHWPNWILAQNFTATLVEATNARGFFRKTRSIPSAFLASLGANLKLGLQSVLNTWLLTMPGCALLLLAWFAGWNNSFHKGYELAAVGPSTGVIGLALFMAAMLYVPLAQARQAVTGEWRAFYDFRLLRKLLRQRWLDTVLLAGLYSLLSLPIMVSMVVPALLPQMSGLEAMSDAEILTFLKRYYFFVSLLGFVLFLFLRVFAARVYAAAILSALRRGAIEIDELRPTERNLLGRLELLNEAPREKRHLIIRALGWTSTKIGRFAATAAVLFVWFTFVAQIFVREFFNAHPVVGWLNQALVQLPWFSYIPEHLRG